MKFDHKVFLVLGGSGRCDAGCPVCRDSVEHARFFEDLPTMLSVYFDVALARRLLCCLTLATSSLRTRSSKPAGEGTMPVHVPSEVVTQLLDVFQGLGVSQHVLGEIRSKASQASQNARVVPGRTRRLAELGEKWLKSASHLEVLREQMTRKESEYLASVQRYEAHDKHVQELEAEYREAKTLLRSPVPSVHPFHCGRR